MQVKAYRKEYYEVELDEQQCEQVYMSYPATSEQLLKRLEDKFIQEIQKRERVYDIWYCSTENTWFTENLQTMQTTLYRKASASEIDFFETMQTMKNILLSREISK